MRRCWAAAMLVVGSLAVLAAACGSSGTVSSAGSTHPGHSTTSSSARARSTTTTTTATGPTASSTTGSSATASGPMVTTSLPVVVCTTSTGAPTTTTSLPPSVSVSVPTSEAQQGNLAVYTDEAGRLMVVGPTVGWTCNGSFGADGSGALALAPVGTSCAALGSHVAPTVVFGDASHRRHGERSEPGARCHSRLPLLQRGQGGGSTERRFELCRAALRKKRSCRRPSSRLASRILQVWRERDIHRAVPTPRTVWPCIGRRRQKRRPTWRPALSRQASTTSARPC